MESCCFSNAAVQRGKYWPTVEACYVRAWEHYEMLPHFHNRAEIMYVVKGMCLVHLYEYEIEAYTQKIQIVKQWTEPLEHGEFIFVDQGILHQLEVPESSYMMNAEFRLAEDGAAMMSLESLSRNAPSLKLFLDSGQTSLKCRDDSGQVLNVLDQVILEFTRSGPKARSMQDVLMAELLLRVGDSAENTLMKSGVLNYVKKAARYIDMHYEEEIRISDIADGVGVAPAYLQRIFKQTMGITMVEYINQVRVEQSKRLLMYTEEPIVDIAFSVGFNSRQHYFRVFNGIMGVSPQRFRQEHRAMRAQEVFVFDHVDDHTYDHEGNRA